ncbi:MAG: FHA domain-containing protein [Phycisphaerales bacterium]|nr:MAG: FHA domain-containing protein [Phycisphaerales bacterium]
MRNGCTVSESRFEKGPVYIGRHEHCQIVLGEKSVSRQHAVIFATPGGKWMVADLNSANRTFLNKEPVHKVEIKTGDRLQIAHFTVEIDLEDHIATD